MPLEAKLLQAKVMNLQENNNHQEVINVHINKFLYMGVNG